MLPTFEREWFRSKVVSPGNRSTVPYDNEHDHIKTYNSNRECDLLPVQEPFLTTAPDACVGIRYKVGKCLPQMQCPSQAQQLVSSVVL